MATALFRMVDALIVLAVLTFFLSDLGKLLAAVFDRTAEALQ